MTPENPNPAPTTSNPPAPKAETAKRGTPSRINQTWAAKISRAEAICLVAKKPANLPRFIANQLPEAYFTELQGLCATARQKQTEAVVATAEKTGDTAAEARKRRTVLTFMQQAQAWARQQFFFSNPSRLGAYHIGEEIDANHEVLKQCSQDILTTAEADALPGVTPQWLGDFEAARDAWISKDSDQAEDGSEAHGDRAALRAMVTEITQKYMTVLFAADGIWPHADPASAATRKALDLPEDRPYSPSAEEALVEE